MTYTTRQYQAVLHCLEQRPEEALTAADLAEALRRSEHPVGLATIYRQLEKLESAGRIHKIHTEEGSFFQFCPHADHHNCFLLRCEDCGRIVHLDIPAQMTDEDCDMIAKAINKVAAVLA